MDRPRAPGAVVEHAGAVGRQDPLEAPRYRNAGHAVYKIVREEGFGALYRGVSLTALRQATNQGASLSFC